MAVFSPNFSLKNLFCQWINKHLLKGDNEGFFPQTLTDQGYMYLKNIVSDPIQINHSQYKLHLLNNIFYALIIICRQIQWNLDLIRCQGTGKICSLYWTPPFKEFFWKTTKMFIISRHSENPAFPNLKNYHNNISVPSYT